MRPGVELVVGLVKKFVNFTSRSQKILRLHSSISVPVRYNSSTVLQAALRIACKQAIPSLSRGASVKTRKFDQRSTGVLNLGGGVSISLTRLCELR